MLAKGVIELFASSYFSPIVIVPKNSGHPQFCIDYRRINSLTPDESSVLPNIADALRDLRYAKVFLVVDLKTGYWQIIKAFSTPNGAAYPFRVMFFVLKVLRRGPYWVCTDIIFSPNYYSHFWHLALVLERLHDL